MGIGLKVKNVAPRTDAGIETITIPIGTWAGSGRALYGRVD